MIFLSRLEERDRNRTTAVNIFIFPSDSLDRAIPFTYGVPFNFGVRFETGFSPAGKTGPDGESFVGTIGYTVSIEPSGPEPGSLVLLGTGLIEIRVIPLQQAQVDLAGAIQQNANMLPLRTKRAGARSFLAYRASKLRCLLLRTRKIGSHGSSSHDPLNFAIRTPAGRISSRDSVSLSTRGAMVKRQSEAAGGISVRFHGRVVLPGADHRTCGRVQAAHRLARDIAKFRTSILNGGATAEADIWSLKQYATRYRIKDTNLKKMLMKATPEMQSWFGACTNQ